MEPVNNMRSASVSWSRNDSGHKILNYKITLAKLKDSNDTDYETERCGDALLAEEFDDENWYS